MDIKLTEFKIRTGKVGVKNSAGRIVVPAAYDYISICTPWIIAWKNPLFNEEIRQDGPYDGQSELYDSHGRRFSLSYQGQKVEHTVYSINAFDRDLYKVIARVNGQTLQTLMDVKGTLLAPFQYELIWPFDYEKNRFGDEPFRMPQTLFKVGNSIEYQWEQNDRGYWHYVIKRGKWGLVDRSFKVVLPVEYDGIWANITPESQDFYAHYIEIRQGEKRGLLRRDGSEILPILYTFIDLNENESLIRYYYKGNYNTERYKEYCDGGLWGLGSIQDMVFTAPIYEAVVFKNGNPGYIAQAIKNNVPGFITKSFSFEEDSSLSVKSILHESNVFWEDQPERPDYGWTQAELDEMYRAAYENDPGASWNNY